MKIKAHLVKREPGRSRRNGVMTGEVARALRQAIFQGEFQPGEPLPELHLAKRFGVSQAIIREAFGALGNSGLVRRFPTAILCSGRRRGGEEDGEEDSCKEDGEETQNGAPEEVSPKVKMPPWPLSWPCEHDHNDTQEP